MKRRDFLKSTVPVTALMHARLKSLAAQAEAPGSDTDAWKSYDLIVIGGSLGGCFAAWHAARKGMKVLLVERRTFLANEITATMRPWLRRDGFADWDPQMKELFLPTNEQDEVGVPFDPDDTDRVFRNEIPLFMGTVKKQFMQLLQQTGADILVGTGVWGVLSDDQQQAAAGLVLAGKFGLHTVRGCRIIDARGQMSAFEDPADRQVSYSVELYGVDSGVGREVSVPESLDLLQDRVFVHTGKRKSGQCFLEFRFATTQADVEHEARQRTETVCAHLIREKPGFAKARIVQLAWETLSTTSNEAATQRQPYANYTRLPYRASFDLSCQDVYESWQEAKERVSEVSSWTETCREPSLIYCRSGKIPLSECQVESIQDSHSNYALQQITFPVQRYLPEVSRADVVVAGGGTAGAMAALGSIQQGARTVTVESLPELGGTSTVGRVTGYYAGYKDTHFYELIEEGVKQQGQMAGRCNRGVARMLYYRKQAMQPGGSLLTDAIICGVFKNGCKVVGLVVEKAGELSTIRGHVVIDATGDGDVAAFAGADYEVGNQRMLCTQNYSQWDVNPGVTAWEDSSTNRDHDILWSHHLSEWQRGYQLSHQQAHYYDFTPFLTVRESRRITGDYTITLKDVILKRRHPDAICMATSDYDPHHFGDTIFTRVGCLLPHQISAVVEIPYRAILPRNIDNLLISAKAISQSHNALQFTRMSFDIMTLGYVTGKIAANVVKQEVTPREFDVTSLQGELRDLKILPPPESPQSAAPQTNGQSLAQAIDELSTGTPNSLLKIMMQPANVAEPPLRRAHALVSRDNQKRRLAKALAWFGNPLGNELIIAEMKRLFDEEQAAGELPREYYREDKGRPYWTINQDIALLALAGDCKVLPEILALADAIPLGQPPVKQTTKYNQGRIDLRLIPFYNRIVIICFAIERMPHKVAIRSLNRLLDGRFIREQVSRKPEEAGDKVYGGILESRLATTLARCGAKRGFAVLIEYLNDVHPMLANYAHCELKAILAQDYGHDQQRWKERLDRLTFPLEPAPCKRDVVEL